MISSLRCYLRVLQISSCTILVQSRFTLGVPETGHCVPMCPFLVYLVPKSVLLSICYVNGVRFKFLDINDGSET